MRVWRPSAASDENPAKPLDAPAITVCRQLLFARIPSESLGQHVPVNALTQRERRHVTCTVTGCRLRWNRRRCL